MIRMIVLVSSGMEKNTHIEKNLKIFTEIGVNSEYVNNLDFIKKNPKGYDAIYLNWFENIDGGSCFRVLLRYILKNIEMLKIKRNGLVVIFTKHNRVPHSKHFLALANRLYRNICDSANIIISFNTDAEIDFIEVFGENTYHDKIRYIPPVNYVDAYPQNLDSCIYSLVKKDEKHFNVVFIGKILPYKNVELVIEAANKLKSLPITFFVAGAIPNDSYGNQVRVIVESCDNVISYLHRIDDKDMSAVLDVADVLVMPYDKTSASNSGTARLAFSYGRTVVSPLISSMKVIPQELVYCYDYQDKEEHRRQFLTSLTQAFNDWSFNKVKYYEKGMQLKLLMKNEYSEEVVREKYLSVFQELFPEKYQ